LLSTFSAGGARGDLRDNGWKPRIKNVCTKRARSLRSLRMQRTTASTSNFSSANSNNERKDCFDASGGRTSGNTTYKMLFNGFKTVSHLVYLLSVTCNLMVMRIGRWCCKIFLTTSWQSSSEQVDMTSSGVESAYSISEYSEDVMEMLLPTELTDVFLLKSFKNDALSWSVLWWEGTSGPPQRPYTERDTVWLIWHGRGVGRGRHGARFTAAIAWTRILSSNTTTTKHWVEFIIHVWRHIFLIFFFNEISQKNWKRNKENYRKTKTLWLRFISFFFLLLGWFNGFG